MSVALAKLPSDRFELRGALRQGFINHPNLAVHSEALEPLRSHAGFQAVLEEVEPRWRAVLDWEKGLEG